MLNYKTDFLLDKQYYLECYEESVVPQSIWQKYRKALFLLFIGSICVLYANISPYFSWFIFALGVLELAASYYQKSWWLLRQLLSKEAQASVHLIITDDFISTSSHYFNNKMYWHEISKMKSTNRGWLLHHKNVRHYISHKHLSNDVINFLQKKCR